MRKELHLVYGAKDLDPYKGSMHTELLGVYTSDKKATEFIRNYDNIFDALTLDDRFNVFRFANIYKTIIEYRDMYSRIPDDYKDHPVFRLIDIKGKVKDPKYVNLINTMRTGSGPFIETVGIFGDSDRVNTLRTRCADCNRSFKKYAKLMAFRFNPEFIDRTQCVYKVIRYSDKPGYIASIQVQDIVDINPDDGVRFNVLENFGWSSKTYNEYKNADQIAGEIDKQFFDIMGKEFESVGDRRSRT